MEHMEWTMMEHEMAMVDDMAMRSEATKPPKLVTTLDPYADGKLVSLWWFNGDLMGFTTCNLT